MATRTSPRRTSQARRRASRPIGIHCVPSHYALLPRKNVRLRAVLSRPTRAALTYTWSTDVGWLTSSGSLARFDSTGVVGGIGARVWVRVRSAGGRRGRAQCRIDILPRVPAPGVFTCVVGGFRQRSYALRDVDLACLDDVSTWVLRSPPPRARILIVGHADPRESNPHGLGLGRARAAAAYMVDSRDVPRFRVVVATAGAARPRDPGQGSAARARNRRVEVTLFSPPVPAQGGKRVGGPA